MWSSSPDLVNLYFAVMFERHCLTSFNCSGITHSCFYVTGGPTKLSETVTGEQREGRRWNARLIARRSLRAALSSPGATRMMQQGGAGIYDKLDTCRGSCARGGLHYARVNLCNRRLCPQCVREPFLEVEDAELSFFLPSFRYSNRCLAWRLVYVLCVPVAPPFA
jgi:hypothetical protein